MSADARGAAAQKKVVIVDDSRALRAWLRVVIEEDPRLCVVGEAATALEAREVIKQTVPDVLTLDIEMPGMDGLEFLARLMRLRPMPVVMISGSTRNHSEATVRALSLGAVDYILKPATAYDEAARQLIARRVFSAACSTVQLSAVDRTPKAAAARPRSSGPMPLVLIGASTGGVAALETVLGSLDTSGPPVVVVQHMPGPFLVSFSRQLDRHLAQDVRLVTTDEVLEPGQIRLAPAEGAHTQIIRRGGQWSCRFSPGEENALHCPSVDALFTSAAPYSADIIAVILTGLGQDGAEGMATLSTNGAMTFGQDEASSVVYGMPRAAFERGAVKRQLPVTQIGAAVNDAAVTWARASRIGAQK